jgi:hypothetical protein
MVGCKCDTNRVHKKRVQELYQTAVVINGHAWETFITFVMTEGRQGRSRSSVVCSAHKTIIVKQRKCLSLFNNKFPVH